jgi:hypothetical protein
LEPTGSDPAIGREKSHSSVRDNEGKSGYDCSSVRDTAGSRFSVFALWPIAIVLQQTILRAAISV